MDLPPSRDSGKTVHFGGNIESSGAGGGGGGGGEHIAEAATGGDSSAAITRVPLAAPVSGIPWTPPLRRHFPLSLAFVPWDDVQRRYTMQDNNAELCPNRARTVRKPVRFGRLHNPCPGGSPFRVSPFGSRKPREEFESNCRARTAGNTSRSRFSRTGSPPRRGFRTCNPSALPRQRDATPFPVNRASPAACAARWRLHVQRGEPRQEPRIVGRAKTGVLPECQVLQRR